MSRWAVHVCGKMPLCVHGNVPLIGDAVGLSSQCIVYSVYTITAELTNSYFAQVHVMTTNASAGAGQAIEVMHNLVHSNTQASR